MTSPPTLKPCPFCGEQPVLEHGSILKDGIAQNGLCLFCHARGPLKYSEAEAISAWNTRVPDVLGELESKIDDMSELPGNGWNADDILQELGRWLAEMRGERDD